MRTSGRFRSGSVNAEGGMAGASLRSWAGVCFAAAILVAGCAGGNRLISSRAGDVESGKLDLADIPVRPEPDEYVINKGDALDVLFLYNSEFNLTDLKVRPDGKISLPYVGDVVAAGRPVSELDSVLTARYSDIIVKPEITVVMRQYRPLVVYLLGEAEHAGSFEFRPGMTLTGLLASASAPGAKAKRLAVVMRRVAPERIVGIQIDLKELLNKNRFDLDIPLQPFDIVYIPKSALQSGKEFAEALRDVLVAPADVYLKGWQVGNIQTFYNFYKKSGVLP